MRHVLILSNVRSFDANTIHDHQNALLNEESVAVYVVNPLLDREVLVNLERFDAVIIHYTLVCFMDSYLNENYRGALKNFRGLKVLFIQDEYRFIYEAVDAMLSLGIDILFTLVSQSAVEPMYGHLQRRGVRIEPTLTGYVPDNLVKLPRRSLAERELDVVYRGRLVPFHLGRLGTEKVTIANQFSGLAQQYDLKIDVDWREEARIYGDRWIRFLSSGRTALGTESGASICDFTGELDRSLKEYLNQHPSANFEEVFDALLRPYEGNVMMNVISPRVFEAIALGTALVQFPGWYSNVLEAHDHYVVLEKDFSNFQEVVDKIRDTPLLEKTAQRAYDDIIRSGRYSYSTFAKNVYRIMREEWERRVQRHPFLPGSVTGPAPGVASKPKEVETAEAWRSLVGQEISLSDARRRAEKQARETEAAAREADWRRTIEEEVQNRQAAIQASRPRDLALANEGASVSTDVPFFPRPNDPDYLLREPMEGGYAAAHFGAPRYSLELELGRAARVARIEIDWFSDENFPAHVILEARIASGEPWRSVAEVQNNESASQIFDLPDRRVIRILRLTCGNFVGQQRMLVRGLRVVDGGERFEPYAPAEDEFDALDGDRGATVASSSPFFPPPHHAAQLIGPLTVNGYSAAVETGDPSQWLEFDLGRPYEVRAVEIVWYSPSELALDFKVECRARTGDVWTLYAREEDNWREHTLFKREPLVIRSLRLSATRFSHQNRLLIRRMHVWAVPADLVNIEHAKTARESRG